MAKFAVTAPWGTLPHAAWRCLVCELTDSSGQPGGGEAMDTAARRHVADYGHPVSVVRGTKARLEPLALEVPDA